MVEEGNRRCKRRGQEGGIGGKREWRGVGNGIKRRKRVEEREKETEKVWNAVN